MISLLNSDSFYSCGLVLLESTFILVVFLLLHGMKRFLGSAPFYTVFGVVFVFIQQTASAGLCLLLDRLGMEVNISTAALLIPCLSMVLVIYAVDGTLAAQRLIFSFMAVFGIFTYLCSITTLQCAWKGYSISQGIMADILQRLLQDTGENMASSVISFTFDLFLIPMIYQQLYNKKCGVFISTIGAMLLGHILDQLIFFSVFYWGEPHFLQQIQSRFFPQALLAAWAGFITAVYLARLAEGEQFGETHRHTIDVLLAFFGSYGKAKLLEQNLRESEHRWRTIIQNASDFMIVTDDHLTIVDANKAALKFFHSSKVADLVGHSIEEAAKPGVIEFIEGTSDSDNFKVRLSGISSPCVLELRKSKITLDGLPAFVLIGNDVTERERLAQEREQLQIENAHRQRLEAIGRLAGGIAHDFNNHIHAINGHLDLIYMGEVTEESMRHLQKIDAIAQQAGKLTSQLLGYARKGRRQNKLMLLDSIVRDSLELFIPDSRTGLKLNKNFQPHEIQVEGDHTQLTQAILNIMINARDAMSSLPEKDRILTISLGTSDWLAIQPKQTPDIPDSPAGWCGIRIEDTGPGVPADIQNKIFEPFFTTKPTGQGTGMGLSMAYGVALEHNGWIQYDRASSGGASFTLFLPILPTASSLSENPKARAPESAAQH